MPRPSLAQLERNIPPGPHAYRPADPFALSIHSTLRANHRNSIQSVDDIITHKHERTSTHPPSLSPSIQNFTSQLVKPYDGVEEQIIPVRPPVRTNTRPWEFESSHVQVRRLPHLQSESSRDDKVDDGPIPFKVIIYTFLFFVLPRQIYLHCLLRIPYMYFSRSIQIFTDAEMNLEQLKRMALVLSEGENSPDPNLEHKRINSYRSIPKSYYRLKETWYRFIDSLMREWKTLNIVSALMLYGILGIFQIEGADRDALTRYAAFCSSICALLSLMCGCIFIIRFEPMRKVTRACEWAVISQASKHVFFWNVWVMLAMPIVWLIWSIVAYVVCIMALMWRVSRDSEGKIQVPVVSPHTELALRIFTCSVLGVGLVYVGLVINTMRYYGSRMDEAWRVRMEEYSKTEKEKERDENGKGKRKRKESENEKRKHQNQHTQVHWTSTSALNQTVAGNTTPGMPLATSPSPPPSRNLSHNTCKQDGSDEGSKNGSNVWEPSESPYNPSEGIPVAEDTNSMSSSVPEVSFSLQDRQRNVVLDHRPFHHNSQVIQGTVPLDILTPAHGSLRSTNSNEKVKNESNISRPRTGTEKRNDMASATVEDTNNVFELGAARLPTGVVNEAVGSTSEDQVQTSIPDQASVLNPGYPEGTESSGVPKNVKPVAERNDSNSEVLSNTLLGNQQDGNKSTRTIVGRRRDSLYQLQPLHGVDKSSSMDINKVGSPEPVLVNFEDIGHEKPITDDGGDIGDRNSQVPVDHDTDSDDWVSARQVGESGISSEDEVQDEIQGSRSQSDSSLPQGVPKRKRSRASRKRSTSRKRKSQLGWEYRNRNATV